MPDGNDKKAVSIEEKITQSLSGGARENALDYVGFMRENGISFDSNNDGEGWAVGGVVGNSLGFMLVNGSADFPGPWTLWFNSCEFEGEDKTDETLKQAAWGHASPCGQCHPGWKDCGGGDRVIFGKEFGRLCHSPLMFTNPDAKTLESVKKLSLMLK